MINTFFIYVMAMDQIKPLQIGETIGDEEQVNERLNARTSERG